MATLNSDVVTQSLSVPQHILMEISDGLPLFIVKEDAGPDRLHDLDCHLWSGGVPLALSSVFS